MKKKKIVYSLIAAALIFIIGISSAMSGEQMVAEASSRFYGVQHIVDNLETEPFVILEIVPDDAYASFGYYVEGYEADYDSRLLASCNTVAARQAKALEAFANIVSDTEKSTLVPLLLTKTDLLYEEQLYITDSMTGWQELEMPYTTAEDGTVTYYAETRRGGYVLASAVGLDAGNYDCITVVEEVTTAAAEETTTATEATTIATEATTTATEVITAATEVTTTATEVTTTATEEATTTAAVDETTTAASAETETTTTYTYVYNPGEGEYVWVDSADGEEYYVEFEKIYYNINVSSRNWFSEYVLEVTDADNIEVITVTPSELEANVESGYLAEKADGTKIKSWAAIDLLYLSNSTCLTYTEDDLALLNQYSHFVTDETAEGEDISWATASNIYEYVYNTNLPVIVDDSIIPDSSTDEAVAALTTQLKEGNNILRLACMLKAYSAESTGNTFADLSSEEWTDEVAAAVIPTTADATFGKVDGSVYVNNPSTETTTAATKVRENIVNCYFHDIFYTSASLTEGSIITGDETVLKGLTTLLSEIETENFYNRSNETDYTLEYIYNETDDTYQISISQASILKYIIGYSNRRISLYKDSITVLDIEPTKYSTLTEEQIRGWLGDSVAASKIKEINIVQTTTAEFIGKVEDLSEEYDLIYFGSCIGSYSSGLHGSFYTTTSNGTTKTSYNDTYMNGLIYSHVGDTVTVKKEFAGLMNTDFNTNGKISLSAYSTRYPGNDITKEKMNDLIAFVDAGYPVIVSNTFYSGNTVNASYVDNSSYIYQFMNTYSGTNSVPNMMSEGSISAQTLARYINMPKLYLSMISVPTEYEIIYANTAETKISQVTYLEEVGGKYTLNYTFELTDTAEESAQQTNYTAQLYVDTNADGKYVDSEELDGLTIKIDGTGTEVDVTKLKTGVRYTLSRDLPTQYEGLVPWKLTVSTTPTKDSDGNITNAGTIVSSSTTGYTAVKAKSVVTINVLQINANSAPKLSLQKDHTNSLDVFDALFEDLEKNMNYKINIQDITVSEYVSKCKDTYSASGQETYSKFLSQYDMLILGFKDCYTDIGHYEATQGIKLFIESGKSVLFSHDTTSFVNTENTGLYASGNGWDSGTTHWGYYLNQYIRSTVGMDRYGITEDDLSFLKDNTNLSLKTTASNGTVSDTTYKVGTGDDAETKTYIDSINALNKDFAYAPNASQNTTVKETHGFTNTAISDALKSGNRDYYYTTTETRVTSITQVNQGQITTFPYNINLGEGSRSKVSTDSSYYQIKLDKASVATTHSQYYQLDMQLDKTGEGDSDIVVWYCLADGIYDAMPNDVRNNYYIYSVGNVTYTGMGHIESSFKTLTTQEAKLFVNTIMASYNAGKRNPSINIVEESDDKGTVKEYTYRTFDSTVGMETATNEEIYFYVNDSNMIDGQKTINVKYYYEIGNDSVATVADTLTEIPTAAIKSSSSTVTNNKITTLVLDGEWLNEQVTAAAAANGNVKIYVGAQTTLDYSATNRDTETTDEVLACLTVKKRDLMNLD